MRSSRPSIYYLHPLLAGPLHSWPRHIERCARLGFDHLLVAPFFLPGRSGNIFTVSDHNTCHPILEWDGAADDATAAVAKLCRDHGLTLLLDLVIHRIASNAALVSKHPDWFATTPDETTLPDPRTTQVDRSSVAARSTALVRDTELGGWWRERLRRWLDAGVAGFRCHAPDKIPPAALRDLIEAARRHASGTRFIAWTPGVAQGAITALAGCPFDHTVSSTAWWDYRAEWLLDEEARLRTIAPPLGLAETPFGPRLTEGCTDSTLLQRRYRRAILFAASYGAGWIMPMGTEFASPRRLDPARDQPEDFNSLCAASGHDCSGDIRSANAVCAAAPLVAPKHASRLVLLHRDYDSLAGSG